MGISDQALVNIHVLILCRIANGIETLEDLESVAEDDINSEFGFNFGEKKRVRKLLHLGTLWLHATSKQALIPEINASLSKLIIEARM